MQIAGDKKSRLARIFREIIVGMCFGRVRFERDKLHQHYYANTPIVAYVDKKTIDSPQSRRFVLGDLAALQKFPLESSVQFKREMCLLFLNYVPSCHGSRKTLAHLIRCH